MSGAGYPAQGFDLANVAIQANPYPAYAWLREHVATPDRMAKVKQLEAVARDLGTNRAQLALAWCLKNPHVSTVITGASKVEQVKENMKALEVLPKLTDAVMERIEGVLQNDPNADDDED